MPQTHNSRDPWHQTATGSSAIKAAAGPAAATDVVDALAATKDLNSTAEVAAADDVSTAAAEEYAAYLEGQRLNGWKD